jgi:hypothetical protein
LFREFRLTDPEVNEVVSVVVMFSLWVVVWLCLSSQCIILVLYLGLFIPYLSGWEIGRGRAQCFESSENHPIFFPIKIVHARDAQDER